MSDISLRKKNDIRRGDIWTADFDSAGDADTAGMLFVVIVSNDSANRHSDQIQVVPIGFHKGRAYPCEAVITMKRCRQQKAVADRIQTISKDRLISRLQPVGRSDMADLDRAIMLQLGLMPVRVSSDVARTRVNPRTTTRPRATR